MNIKNSLLKTTAAVAAIVLTFSGCGNSSSAEDQKQQLAVTAASPVMGDIAIVSNYIGTAEPAESVNIIPLIQGTVEKIHVKVGDTVKKGDLLISIDQKDIMPAYNQAKAAYDMAKAQTTQMTGSSYKANLANVDSTHDTMKEKYLDARYAYEKAEEAYEAIPDTPETAEQKAQAKAAMLAAKDGMNLAKKYYVNARNSYDALLGEGFDELQDVADATMENAKAGLMMAQDKLNNTRIKSPINGVVEAIFAKEKNMVSAQPVAVVSNKDTILVNFGVSAKAVTSIHAGDVVTIENGNDRYSATVTEVSTVAMPQTGLFPVKAVIDEEYPNILSGVNVKVMAKSQHAENTMLVAQDSIYYDDGMPYVYVAEDGKAVRRDIIIGIENSENAEVVGGLHYDDLVINSWNPNLKDGADVLIKGGEENNDAENGPEECETPEDDKQINDEQPAEDAEKAEEEADSEGTLIEPVSEGSTS